MTEEALLITVAFVGAGGLILLLFALLGGRQRRLVERLHDEPPKPAVKSQVSTSKRRTQAALTKIGSVLMPGQEEQGRLAKRLIHAGYYNRNAVLVLLGVKVLFMALPAVLGLTAVVLGFLTPLNGVLWGLVGSLLGMVIPGLLLDHRKRTRQLLLRKAVPDAFDMIGLCLEGGMSLPAAFSLIVDELRIVHPLMVSELDIAQREIQLGRTTGEALASFAERTDLDEVRSLASAVIQSERLGSSLVRAFRVYADTLRQQRVQRAEETAQKASTKIVFPTVLFIFPSIFLVVLGPSVIHIWKMFANP